MTQKQLEKAVMTVIVAFIMAIVLLSSAHAQNPGGLVPLPKMQFFDANGLPLNGGKVYTYAAGTTTPLATCTDVSCGTPNANPVILDSGGFANIWFSNAAYKVILKTSADVQIWSVDNVSQSCSIVGCLMTGTLNISATVSPALQVSTSAGGTSTSISNSGSAGIALSVTEGSTSGGTIGVFATAASATGVAIQAFNSSASGNLFSGLNRLGQEKFFVANTGAISTSTSLSIAGGTALTTTNQTGTGSLVLATSPTVSSPTITTPSISAPAITGNMTYANTTPVANLTGQVLLYNTAGSQLINAHAVLYSAPLVSGTPSTLTVTLSSASVFTSNTTYRCSANNENTSTNGLKVSYTSGSQFIITGPNTVTDTVSGICTGN